ncbi:MAG: hypothetical protein M3198_15620 [Actinomycetota bacterium]|nr:hypothetical protein [Actinomycetota bacterium]
MLRAPVQGWVAVSLTLLISAGCSGEKVKPAAKASPSCDLPAPAEKLDLTGVPTSFSPTGTELSRIIRSANGFTVALNVDGSVEDAQDLYRAAVLDDGFDVLSEDFEGIEAELYLQRNKEYATVRIISTACPSTSRAYVQLVGTVKEG